MTSQDAAALHLGIIWLAFYVVKMFVPVPAMVEKAIWVVVLILILIAVLTLLAGGGGSIRGFRITGDGTAVASRAAGAVGAYATRSAIDLQGLLVPWRLPT